MAVKGKPYKGPILTCLVFLIIYNFYVRDLERKMAGWALSCTRHCISWSLDIPWQMCRVLCKCPGSTLTARIKPSASQCPKCGHCPHCEELQPISPICSSSSSRWLAVSLQNTFPLSCLNFVRTQGLINPCPAVSDQDRLVFQMLVTCEGQHRR